MVNFKNYLKSKFAYVNRAFLSSEQRDAWAEWASRNFTAPSPHFVKQICLLRNGIAGGTWVETGTYLGQTTEVLARLDRPVFSIEPEPGLFANAKSRLSRFPNVQILHGISEEIFPSLLPRLTGNINFWLDGHYSAGITFKGPQDTPIIDELGCISRNLSRFKNVCVQIDDVRCFNPLIPEYSTYPSINVLVDWARNHRLDWHIEQDIFVARNRG